MTYASAAPYCAGCRTRCGKGSLGIVKLPSVRAVRGVREYILLTAPHRASQPLTALTDLCYSFDIE